MEGHHNHRPLYFILFALSGFAGLIYESIWTHYLKLFLGHAAYAQTLVLVIFMGGMAMGAWIASCYVHRIRNPLLAYAFIEGLIGLLALIFHPLFIQMTELAYVKIIPVLGSVMWVKLFKWSMAALMIFPQSILLGTTFPLMTTGIIRYFPNRPGHSLAILYFANSLGAAIGILVSGFILIERVGLPGTILTGGLLNIFIALVVWLLCHTYTPQPALVNKLEDFPNFRIFVLAFLGCAALTGASSFLYEIGWIRMLNLVLGSSTHSFELMLSAFILGLALGSYWIRKHLDMLSNPLKILGIVQILMGLLALSTLFSYGHTFSLMTDIMTTLTKTEPGYFIFNLSSHAIAMLIMLPATICAGMTLPLLTYYLIGQGYGEKTIGNIYAANTLGAIVGVVLGVQVIMPTFGLKNLITLGGGMDIFLGIALLWYAGQNKRWWSFVTLVTSMIWLVSTFGSQFDHLKMVSGVFRYGKIQSQGEVLFHKDGKTASVDLFKSSENELTLSTNGKPDATIGEHSVKGDELTMVLMAALPYSINPEMKTVANIGLGSGLTSHVLLSIPTIEQVDTIEIEPAMVEGAKGFGKRVQNTFQDLRSHIYIEDAKTYFTTYQKVYDLIISEPSNPWVSGVGGLFSEEFYHLVSKYLSEKGIFGQWLHLYELDIRLVASVLKAISKHFANYVIYFPVEGDILIIATQADIIPAPQAQIFTLPQLASELAHIGVFNQQDLLLRYLGSNRILAPLFQSYDIPTNSDYFPILDLGAVKTRFLNKNASELYQFKFTPAPLLEVLEHQVARNVPLLVSDQPHFVTGQKARQAKHIFLYLQSLKEGQSPSVSSLEDDNVALVRSVASLLYQPCPAKEGNGYALEIEKGWLPYLQLLAQATLPYLSPSEMAIIWATVESSPCFSVLPEKVRRWLNLYQAVSSRNFEQVLQYASLLLPSEKSIPASLENYYLLVVTGLAHVALQHSEKEVLALWQRYQFPPDSSDIELRLLWTSALQKCNLFGCK